jgi:formate dehydrogenase
MQTVTFRRPVGRNKGRQVEPAARERVRALLADAPRRRDLLVEHLHLIQDADGHLSAAMLAALAGTAAAAGGFEVASFYHHFDVVKEGGQAPPVLTVGVCDSLSCALAGADALAGRLEELLGASVRVRRVPCVGRCAQAPVAVVQRHPVAPATAERVAAAVRDGLRECPPADAGDAAVGGAATAGHARWAWLGRKRCCPGCAGRPAQARQAT